MNGTPFDKEDLVYSISWFYRRLKTEEELLKFVSTPKVADEDKLAAALLLCTCDSNERKAGE